MLHHNHQHHGQQRTPTQTNISNINSNNLQFYNKPYPLISIESQQQPVKNIINHSQSQNAIVIQQTSASSISPIKLDQSVIDYDSDESTDSEDASSNKKSSHHIYVTFDVPTQAARLLKKFASENFHRLNEIGIKSVKLKNEPTIKVSKKQEVCKTEVTAPVLIPISNETLIQPQNVILADVKPVNQVLNPIHQSVSQQQSHQLQQQQPTTKKRNRKTINELTSSSYMSNTETHQHQQEAINQQAQGLQISTSRNIIPEQISSQSPNLNNTASFQQQQSFYQIDKDGNLRQQQSNVIPFQQNQQEQLSSNAANKKSQSLQQFHQNNVYNFNNNNNNNINNPNATSTPNNFNNKNFQYQVMNPPTQQQYRMPSPMLANLLSTSSGNHVTDSAGCQLTNQHLNQINNPVVIRQTSNNNYEYLNNNQNNNTVHGNGVSNFNPQQQHHNHQQHQPDYNLMKSDDYKHIYQMRQTLASQTAPNPQFNCQLVNNNSPSTQSATVQPTTTAPKRKRAPADPSKVRTKRTKATIIITESLIRNETSNNIQSSSSAESTFNRSISIPNDNNSSNQSQIQQQPKLLQTDKTKIKTVNTLIDELNTDTVNPRTDNNDTNNEDNTDHSSNGIILPKNNIGNNTYNNENSNQISINDNNGGKELININNNNNTSLLNNSDVNTTYKLLSTSMPVSSSLNGNASSHNISIGSSSNYISSSPLPTNSNISHKQLQAASFINFHSDQTSLNSNNNSSKPDQIKEDQIYTQQQQQSSINSNSTSSMKPLNYISFKLENTPSSSSVSSSSSNGLSTFHNHSFIISQQQQHIPKISMSNFPASSEGDNLVASSTCVPSSSGSIEFMSQVHFQQPAVSKLNFLVSGDENESIITNS